MESNWYEEPVIHVRSGSCRWGRGRGGLCWSAVLSEKPDQFQNWVGIRCDLLLRHRAGKWACWSDDGMVGKVRVAGPQYPLARSETDPTVVFDPINMAFGGPHPGICQFVKCDGSVQVLNNSTNTTVLGYMANRFDGQVIPDEGL